MLVGISTTRADSEDVPIVLILSASDREYIANMDPEAKAICFYNEEKFSRQQIVDLMEYHVPTRKEWPL